MLNLVGFMDLLTEYILNLVKGLQKLMNQAQDLLVSFLGIKQEDLFGDLFFRAGWGYR